MVLFIARQFFIQKICYCDRPRNMYMINTNILLFPKQGHCQKMTSLRS